jgi:hypothetical protein
MGVGATLDDFIVGSQNRYGEEIGSGDNQSDPRSDRARHGGAGNTT